ncbi:Zn(2)-C6 fungal-type domain-containing protein [Mycena indigotica]|uniref:Zn(2)-C6 fungal-type domain-containing protein n=1 Tax=Mycena indigotica TaxID=2126181 RepID=A0A8H6RY31_9AGAR|nr:Zn(2)-C6 fungal-type domain-containing protein [Mycena indigotica]KAF7288997.1 Zn(2)-C6 fungal-type domain-containing protein [Mycena indigotica]
MAPSLWIGVSTLWVSTLLYGIYLVLFWRCMSILLRGSRSGSSQHILLISAIIMFTLSTTSVLIFLLQGATAYGSVRLRLDELQIAGAVVYVTNNVFADALLIYRCYVIWNTVYVTIVPLLLLAATMFLGYAIQLKLFFILSLTTNLLVPALVAGRLWWVLRRIRGIASEQTRKQGRKAMVILLESGLIYSLVVSIHMIYFHYDNPMDQVVYAALAQLVGIVPTLIIVRVGRGVSQDCNDNTTTMVGSSGTMTRQASMRSGHSDVEKNDDDADARTIVVHVTHDIETTRGSMALPKLERSTWEADSPV